MAVLFAEPRECNTGVKTAIISNANMAHERGEIVLTTQDNSTADEATCTLTSPTADLGASMDDILEAVHSLGKQNKGIENKMKKQGLKIELQVQEILQRVEELCTRVNKQVTQLETGLKLHEDKRTLMNALEEEFTKRLSRF